MSDLEQQQANEAYEQGYNVGRHRAKAPTLSMNIDAYAMGYADGKGDRQRALFGAKDGPDTEEVVFPDGKRHWVVKGLLRKRS
jgi:hypothetical protein